MADIQPGQVLTPEKKFVLADALKTELDSLNKTISLGGMSAAQAQLAQASKNAVQNILNSILQKKGVITPDETDAALLAIDKSKKARLKSDFILGIKKSTIFLFVIVGLGVGSYLYFKNKK